jgi:hypothetical protein
LFVLHAHGLGEARIQNQFFVHAHSLAVVHNPYWADKLVGLLLTRPTNLSARGPGVKLRMAPCPLTALFFSGYPSKGKEKLPQTIGSFTKYPRFKKNSNNPSGLRCLGPQNAPSRQIPGSYPSSTALFQFPKRTGWWPGLASWSADLSSKSGRRRCERRPIRDRFYEAPFRPKIFQTNFYLCVTSSKKCIYIFFINSNNGRKKLLALMALKAIEYNIYQLTFLVSSVNFGRNGFIESAPAVPEWHAGVCAQSC